MSVKVIIENKIPFISGLLDDVAEVSYLAPDEITPEAVRDADALIVRTRTRCDAELLDDSKCRFIATATIGTDHIDLDYCRRRSIKVVNAPGCNAPAVAQYVMATLIELMDGGLAGRTLGVVGVGHVGSIVADWGCQLGMCVLQCDPPRAEAEGGEGFSSLEEIARRSDAVTFHTPLVREGANATFHMAGQEFVSLLGKRPILINSARGEVFDTDAIVRGLEAGAIDRVAVDCWENEPEIDARLLNMASIATPHIAGYSEEGKIRATQSVVKDFCRHFGFPEPRFSMQVAPGAATRVTLEAISRSYSPLADTAAFKLNPGDFEKLRNTYRYRAEVAL